MGRSTNRWGDGIDAPAAGARDFFPAGWVPKHVVVRDAIQVFGHSDSDLEALVAKGVSIAAELSQFGVSMARDHATALYAYTEEKPTNLYGKLNKACRTPGGASERRLAVYRDYLFHMQEAVSTLPNYCGRVYRGIDSKINPSTYADGSIITWQQFSSTSKKQQQARKFLVFRPPSQLSGSMFVIDVKTGKEVEELSQFPEEEEVMLRPNTFFTVIGMVGNDQKRALLSDLSGYDLASLDVYHLSQV